MSTKRPSFEHEGKRHVLTYRHTQGPETSWRCACGANLVVRHRRSEDSGEQLALDEHCKVFTGGDLDQIRQSAARAIVAATASSGQPKVGWPKKKEQQRPPPTDKVPVATSAAAGLAVLVLDQVRRQPGSTARRIMLDLQKVRPETTKGEVNSILHGSPLDFVKSDMPPRWSIKAGASRSALQDEKAGRPSGPAAERDPATVPKKPTPPARRPVKASGPLYSWQTTAGPTEMAKPKPPKLCRQCGVNELSCSC